MEKNNNVVAILVLIFLEIEIFLVIIYNPGFQFKEYNEQELYKTCSLLSLKESIKCVEKFSSKIYKYKVTDDQINLSFSELKEQGGDCKNWAEWSSGVFNNLGFFSTTIVFSLNNSKAHEIAIVNDGKSICYIDTLNHFCRDMKI